MNADLVPVPSQLLERLAAVGVDVARVLRHARLSRSQLAARTRVTTREFFAFWRGVEEVSGARDLGLRLGSEASPHQLDVASLAALHAPNLGEALKKLARYKRLVCPEEIGIEIVDGEARIRFNWILAEEQVPLLIVDGAFAAVVALARRGTPRRGAPPIRAPPAGEHQSRRGRGGVLARLRRVEFIHAGVPRVGGNDTDPLARIGQQPNIESHERTVAYRRAAR